MEPLSGVASGMAVVSLSLQLIKSVSTINVFVRTAKGAPTELNRLLESLDRLRALLQDIYQLMISQISRSGEHIPSPSMTIFNCLKACEQHLQPLQGIVQKYESAQIQDKSNSRRLWSSIKFVFKKNDIMAFEACIQQEMANLTVALSINSSSIQLHAFTILLRSQHVVSISSSPQWHHLHEGKPLEATSTTHQHASLSMPSSVLVAQRVFYSPSYLEQFGFSQHKILRTLRTAQAGRSSSKQIDKEVVLQEEYVYSWAAVWFGYGIRSSWTRPYGSILPSLTTYPVVSRYTTDVLSLISHGTVLELQQAFQKGVVHPLMRDEDGQTLFHLAAFSCRADLCQLLVQVGMKADTESRISLLKLATYFSGIHTSEPALRSPIDTCRFLLNNARLADNPSWRRRAWLQKVDFGLIEWLWETRSAYLCEADIADLNNLCMRIFLSKLHHPIMRYSAVTFLRNTMIPSIIRQHGPGSFDWLGTLFDEMISASELDSFEVGKAFIDILLDINVDVKSVIEENLKNHSTWTWKCGLYPDRRIIFDYAEEQGWTLGWKWVYDAQDPGFLVVSEFSTMAADDYIGFVEEWPFNTAGTSFCHQDSARQGLKWENCFKRRMSAKARKELKRTGQRRVQNKMPGSWIS